MNLLLSNVTNSMIDKQSDINNFWAKNMRTFCPDEVHSLQIKVSLFTLNFDAFQTLRLIFHNIFTNESRHPTFCLQNFQKYPKLAP